MNKADASCDGPAPCGMMNIPAAISRHPSEAALRQNGVRVGRPNDFPIRLREYPNPA